MGSLALRQQKTSEADELDSAPTRCWEILKCGNSFCPAYGKLEEPCWRLLSTGGTERSHQVNSGGNSRSCLLCPVFKRNGERDGRGWNFFVYDELPYLNANEVIYELPKQKDFREALNLLPLGVILTDVEQKIFFLNSAAEKILGVSLASCMGKAIETLLTPFVAQPGGSVLNERARAEFTMHDGRTVLVTRRDSDLEKISDGIPGQIFFLEDITSRKRVEDKLRYFEGEYRRIFEGSKDMIFVHSKGSIFKEVNQACVETLGYSSREELLALRSVERIYVNPIHRRVFQEQIDRNGFVKDFETSFWKKDGSRIHCLISGTAVRDQDGKIIGYEAIAKDITARMDGVRHLLHQHRELSLLHSVAASMNVTHELSEILSTALNKVLDLLNFTSGCVFLVDEEKPAFVLKVQRGFWKDLIQNGYEISFHDQALMRSLLTKDHSIRQQRVFPPFRADLKTGIVSVELTCFLITTKERASGFLALYVPRNRHISDHDCQMLGALGNFLGSAIENARLVQTIHRHREELKQLTARLFNSQEEERKRIAQELHDEVGSSLTGINFALESVERNLPPESPTIKERILDIKKQINRTYQEMRRISHRLHPAVLSELGLEPALESCLSRISKYSQIEIDFKMVGFDSRLDPEVETVLYRISQEAVNNTLKHAGARRFKLSIVKSYPNIILLAEDDGIGFDPASLENSNRRAFGLVVMRERAAMLGGKFSIRSSRNNGTRIRVEIPIRETSLDL